MTAVPAGIGSARHAANSVRPAGGVSRKRTIDQS